jgi:L-lactate dehydrogenase complex protein LldF
MAHSRSLPFASSLCGACYEVCPVKINIPEILIHLRRRIAETSSPAAERAGMRAAALAFSSPSWLRRAQMIGRFLQRPFDRNGRIAKLPGPFGGWTATRDLPALPRQSFREWWSSRHSSRA